MMIARAGERIGEKGFMLIEALVALALTGLVLSMLGTITAQWLPSWNHGVGRIQQSELIGLAMQRLAGDLAAAEYVPPNRDRRKPLFDGSALSVTFVRTALGPNVGVGLDVVRIGETADQGGLVTVRSRAPFGPLSSGASLSEQVNVSDPVVLLRAPLRLSLAYAGPDRLFRDSWHDMDKLPALIMLTVRDAASERVLSVSTATPVHVDTPASVEKSDDDSKGGAKDSPKDDGKDASAAPKPGGS
jgi:general secretion pathway protein J